MIHPDAKVLARGCYRFRGVVREVVLHEEPRSDERVYIVRSVMANTEGPNRIHATADNQAEALAVYHQLVDNGGE